MVSYLVLVPLVMLLYASVKSTEDKLPFEATGMTLANYTTVLTSPSTLPIFLNTFFFTAGSLAVGLPLAVLMAWLLERTAIPARRWIAALILVPMTIPSLLSAIAWIQLLDPRIGIINVVLRNVLGLSGDFGPFDIYTLYGMCFVQGLRLVPSAYLMIAASFRAMDPSLEEQSAMAGRGVGQTTLRITLPIMRPALLAMLIYYIIVVIESFDIPGLLGFTARIRVLSTAIYWATHSEVGLPDYGLASALGALVLFVALLLMWAYQRLTAHQERFATITGKAGCARPGGGPRPSRRTRSHRRSPRARRPWRATVRRCGRRSWTDRDPRRGSRRRAADVRIARADAAADALVALQELGHRGRALRPVVQHDRRPPALHVGIVRERLLERSGYVWPYWARSGNVMAAPAPCGSVSFPASARRRTSSSSVACDPGSEARSVRSSTRTSSTRTRSASLTRKSTKRSDSCATSSPNGSSPTGVSSVAR